MPDNPLIPVWNRSGDGWPGDIGEQAGTNEEALYYGALSLVRLAARHTARVRIEHDPSNPGFGAGCNALACTSSADFLGNFGCGSTGMPRPLSTTVTEATPVGPEFATEPQLYAYFTAAEDNRIVRMSYSVASLGAPEVLVDGIDNNEFTFNTVIVAPSVEQGLKAIPTALTAPGSVIGPVLQFLLDSYKHAAQMASAA